MRVVVQRVLESLGRASRVAATVRHGHTPASLLISRLQASARQNDLTPTTKLWQRRSSVCARPYPSERKGPWRDLGRLEYAALRVRRLVQPPTTKTSKAQCLALPTTAITWNTTYLGAAIDHRLPTHQPPPSIRRHQHNHTTPRPTPTPNRRPNRHFLYRCWTYPIDHPRLPQRMHSPRIPPVPTSGAGPPSFRCRVAITAYQNARRFGTNDQPPPRRQHLRTPNPPLRKGPPLPANSHGPGSPAYRGSCGPSMSPPTFLEGGFGRTYTNTRPQNANQHNPKD